MLGMAPIFAQPAPIVPPVPYAAYLQVAASIYASDSYQTPDIKFGFTCSLIAGDPFPGTVRPRLSRRHDQGIPWHKAQHIPCVGKIKQSKHWLER